MRWRTGRRSTNVVDRRRMGLVDGGIGAVVLTIVSLLLGVNPADLLQGGAPDVGTGTGTGETGGPPPTDPAGDFVSVVLGDTEDTWKPQSKAVRTELQADCFAGVWAHHAQRSRAILEPGDLEEALNAAAAIGDDRLQRQTQGQVVPESFTHGTSEQRVRWFRTGFETGSVERCDTSRGAL